jgi:hypothetical protein
MTDKAISPLRQRLIDDMTIRRFARKTQHHYIRHVKRFCRFPWLLSPRGHRGEYSSVPAAAGVNRRDSANRQRQWQCSAFLLQGHAETRRSC